jgi:hypothetical protein
MPHTEAPATHYTREQIHAEQRQARAFERLIDAGAVESIMGHCSLAHLKVLKAQVSATLATRKLIAESQGYPSAEALERAWADLD